MAEVPGWEGRYFEDFNVGDVYRCRLGRTVSEADNTWFTLLTCNTNQIHFNDDFARRTEFGKCLINSTLTLAIVTGMGVADVSENGVALGWDEVKLPHPLFAGDTLYSESRVLEKRESRSNPQRGVVKVRTRGIQQEGKVVIDYVRSVLVWKKAHAPARGIFPEVTE
ncbi:MAG TPA: MaoC family dehydratase [Candidatus Binatia bacterium]|nr:MaoC family dehydratase [Candidatus Binatia bacterium]